MIHARSKQTSYQLTKLDFSSNIADVITVINEKINGIDVNEMTALQASSVIGEMRKRIHVDGLDSSGSGIGNYSAGYMKVRSGLFKSPTIVRGRNKGAAREKYNRGGDTKVILSLTRQMEGDMTIIPFDGGCGIGFTNAENYKKSVWVEKTYGKNIYQLTEREREIIQITGEKYIEDKLQ